MTRLHVLLCLGVASCANATDDDVINPDAPRAFVVVPGDSKVAVGAALDHDGITQEGVADLVVETGTLELAVDHDGFLLEDASFALRDVALPEAIYPGDIVLTDLAIRVVEPVWCADFACTAPVDLRLTWNAWIGGELHPLEPQTLTGFTLDASLSDGVVDLGAHRDGEFWSYLGVARLSDASIALRAARDVIP